MENKTVALINNETILRQIYIIIFKNYNFIYKLMTEFI
jgi:hypothetical protein